jgi:hypothetical protein
MTVGRLLRWSRRSQSFYPRSLLCASARGETTRVEAVSTVGRRNHERRVE